ncbi:MAG TPA: response regulator [Acidimicrobiia bacterium]|nr:response regulator [Acidimicrobiia bacterium]
MARSVLLVDDVPELRAVIRQTLRLRGGFDIVAEAEDGAGAISAAARHQPDVVVLDLGLPDLAGQEVLTRLRAVTPAAQIVVYSGSVTPDRIALSSEVEAFVTKDHDVSYLVDLLARLNWRRYESARLEIGPDTADVARARRFVADQCQQWGCGDVVEDAQLVVSELVTNALIHGQSRCELRAGLSEAALRLQVVDSGTGMPDPQVAGEGDEHGRGLLLVSAICAAWGVEALPDGGKIVWAELLRPLHDPGDGDPPAAASADLPGKAAPTSPATPGFDSAGGAGPPAPADQSVAVASLR